MHSYETDSTKFKCVCADFSNLMLLTKSDMPGDIQVTFCHASVENKSLGENIAAFDLAGSLESSAVVSIESNRAFTSAGENIRLPVMEVLLCSAVGNLARSKNLRYWESLKTSLFPPLLTEAVVLEGETPEAELLKIFADNISERR